MSPRLCILTDSDGYKVLVFPSEAHIARISTSTPMCQNKLWTIPAERMIANKVHRVPLSDAAIALLESLPKHDTSPYVFFAERGGALSNMSISAVCRCMEVDAVPRSFRSSFKDWARSSTAFPDEVSELALAHVSTDATRAAYARDELLPKRQKLMEAWAKYCATVHGKGTVTPIKSAAA